MYFESWAGFFQMGGHGIYVWSAYVLGTLVVIYNLAAPVLARRRAVRDIRRIHSVTADRHGRHGQKKHPGNVEVMNESGS